MKYQSSLNAKLIYIFRINDKAHEGCLKIGETTINASDTLSLQPNCRELNQAAKARIAQYTKTAAIPYDLLHTELTVYIHKGKFCSFNDKEVHDVLKRSGIKRHDFSIDNQGEEWFEVDLQTALAAIKAVKEGRSALNTNQITQGKNPIVFRPEQKLAIEKTVKKFQHRGKHMLWNAKMRFGKTLSALQVVKECGFTRTMILTHCPVVDAGWFEDFNKIFLEDDTVYRYGSKNNGFTFKELEADTQHGKSWKYVYFASMQDLRGSNEVGGKFNKNDEIFKAEWDCLIIDEAHEGTQTELGQNVIAALTKENTHTLNLSGTPFNLLDDFNEDEVYTWDYVMEQEAKARWELEHFGDPNPYAGLPRLNIYTFDLGKMINSYADVEDQAFNFKEFFRTEEGSFVHEADVHRFLDLIVKYDTNSNYPYSTPEFRKNFRHSLWMVPGVKEARALSALLQQHPIFGQFAIVNVAGEGDEEAENEEALKMVEKAMGQDPEQTFTITLSCGRLTTGVTVRPWTAVFMLAGSASTDAKAYMQTIFRVQSPYETPSGKRKEECFVFDFAPDRTLKVIAEVAKVTAKTRGGEGTDDKTVMGRFLNFCPIIGYNGTRMQQYDVTGMLEQLKRAYVDKVVRNGFEDARLYNDKLLKLTKLELQQFSDLKKIIGATKAQAATSDVDINHQGFTDEEYEEVEKIKKEKKKRELTKEEKEALERSKQQRNNRASAISILRGISIRFPLLIYGADIKVDEDITIENFADLIDDQSWEEFMPRGVTKERFKDFIQYYDEDIFRAAGRRIREMALAADTLTPLQRTKRIAAIFSYFRNPDKETVLTPWRVVNMHMSDCLGGWDFYDATHDEEQGHLEEPRFVEQGNVTKEVFADPQTRILEINSKTGLYPLYVTYSVFAERCRCYRDTHMLTTDIPEETQWKLWDKTLAENIFVICKTPMAKNITHRTLRGYRDAHVNARYFEDLINTIQNKSKQFIDRISDGKNYWKANNDTNMKFNAIVGNPPYQVMQTTEKTTSTQAALAGAIYPVFIDAAIKLNPTYVSMITPSRWMTKAGRGISDEWVEDKLKSNHFLSIVDYLNATDCFEQVEIKGGINYFLYSPSSTTKCKYYVCNGSSKRMDEDYLDSMGLGIVIRDPLVKSILSKIIFKEGRYYEINSFESAVASGTLFCDCAKGILNTSWDGYSLTSDKEHNIKYYLNKSLVSDGYAWIKYSDLIKAHEVLPLHKVYIPKAGGSGNDPIVLGTPFYGEPNSICSQTYICIGFDPEKHNWTKQQCENVISYIKTRMFRFLVSIKKKTQDAFAQVYQFVPLQDFSHPWTDAMLYEKYGLTQEEIDYIESLIKPMN